MRETRAWQHQRELPTYGLRHLHHPLAAVLARQQPDQRLRGVVEAIDDVLLNLELAGGDPGLQIGERLLALLEELGSTNARHDPPIGATASTCLVGLRRSLASLLVKHDRFRKPGSTFRDHALGTLAL
jgi:hypothetical protein